MLWLKLITCQTHQQPTSSHNVLLSTHALAHGEERKNRSRDERRKRTTKEEIQKTNKYKKQFFAPFRTRLACNWGGGTPNPPPLLDKLYAQKRACIKTIGILSKPCKLVLRRTNSQPVQEQRLRPGRQRPTGGRDRLGSPLPYLRSVLQKLRLYSSLSVILTHKSVVATPSLRRKATPWSAWCGFLLLAGQDCATALRLGFRCR